MKGGILLELVLAMGLCLRGQEHPPLDVQFAVTDHIVSLRWNSLYCYTYTVQRSPSMAEGSWVDRGTYTGSGNQQGHLEVAELDDAFWRIVYTPTPDYPGEIAQIPYPVHTVDPACPFTGESWRVVIEMTITVEGNVVDAEVYESTDSLFDFCVLTAVRQWIFNPAYTECGVAVNVRVRQPVQGGSADPSLGTESFPDALVLLPLDR